MSKNDLKDFSQEVAQLLPAIQRAVVKEQGDLFGFGKLTVPQYISLELVSLRSRLIMKDIARELKVTLPAASGLVKRLVALGYVKRLYDTEDRRIIHVILTPKGRKTVDQARSRRTDVIEDIFAKLSKEERRQYLGILKKLHTILYPKKQ